jgi:hypothetical protein
VEILPELTHPVDIIADVKHLPNFRILNYLVLQEGHLLHLVGFFQPPPLYKLLVSALDDRFGGPV